MDVVCSWCSKSMGQKMGPDGMVMHGICKKCMTKIEETSGFCEVHGRYIPVPSWLDRKPTCPKCDKELRDMSPTLAEVNARRGYEE